MANSATFTFGYSNTDFTRTFKIENISASSLSGIKAGVKAINASLSGATDGGLSSFFVADDFDATNNIGFFTGITDAVIDEPTSNTIYIG